jgi:nucleoside-diphosphate-sugar epimerase
LGCGWLGRPLAQHLLAEGFNVKGSTTDPQKGQILGKLGIEAFVIDLGSPAENMEEFLIAEILLVMVPSKIPEQFEKLISYVERSSVEKVLFVSTTSVYGSSKEAITEETDLRLSRQVIIENLFLNNPHFQTTIIRFGGLFGYDRKPGRFFRSGNRIKDPDNVVNLIHRDDCIGIIGAIIDDEAWGEVFNGTSDTHPTKREFYTKAARDIGVDPPEFEWTGSSEMKWVSNEKLKKKLNYVFKYPDLMRIEFD